MAASIAELGAEPDVITITDDSWSTDRITPAGREKLRQAGFAPPTPRAAGETTLRSAPERDLPLPVLRVDGHRPREHLRPDAVPLDPLLQRLSPAVRALQDALSQVPSWDARGRARSGSPRDRRSLGPRGRLRRRIDRRRRLPSRPRNGEARRTASASVTDARSNASRNRKPIARSRRSSPASHRSGRRRRTRSALFVQPAALADPARIVRHQPRVPREVARGAPRRTAEERRRPSRCGAQQDPGLCAERGGLGQEASASHLRARENPLVALASARRRRRAPSLGRGAQLPLRGPTPRDRST